MKKIIFGLLAIISFGVNAQELEFKFKMLADFGSNVKKTDRSYLEGHDTESSFSHASHFHGS